MLRRPRDDAARRQPCAPQRHSGFSGLAAPEREASVLAGVTLQAGQLSGDTTWRARSRTQSPEPPLGYMAAAAHVSWNATVCSELQPRAHADWAEALAREEARNDISRVETREATPRPLLRARLRSPSPRYDSSSRDDSPAGWRGLSWAEQPPVPVKPAFFSRSPSPPLRSRSPAPRYDVRPRSPLRSTAAPHTWGAHAHVEQLHIAANPFREMQRAAPIREMPMLRRGRVARYNAKQRYGFIVDASDPSGPDCFVNNASLAPGCREIDTLRVGAYVTFRCGSRLVNGCVVCMTDAHTAAESCSHLGRTMKQYAYDVALDNAYAMRRADGLEMRGTNAQQQRRSPENAAPHVRGGGRPCAPRR